MPIFRHVSYFTVFVRSVEAVRKKSAYLCSANKNKEIQTHLHKSIG